MRRPTVLLYDVDGTLVDTGGAGRRSIAAAFERHFAEAPSSFEKALNFPFGGMTDRAIVRRGLVGAQVEATEAVMDAIIRHYLAILQDEVARSTRYRVIEGVAAAVAHTAQAASVAVGLGTGNVEDGARIKLRRSGIDQHFAFGGYGSDAEDRAALLGIGAERGAARLGARREACRVVIIGDTPKDVAAARALGVESLAVATGSFSVDELARSEPTRVVSSLAEEGVLAWLLDPEPSS